MFVLVCRLPSDVLRSEMERRLVRNKELPERRGAWCGTGGCLLLLVPLFPPWAADADEDVDHQLETALGVNPCDALWACGP